MSFEAECLELCLKQLEATVATAESPYSPSVWRAGIWRQWTLWRRLQSRMGKKICAAEWETYIQCMQLLPWRARIQTREGGMPTEHGPTAVVPELCQIWLWFSQERPERIQLPWAGLGASPVLGKENWTVWLSGLTPSFLFLYCILYLRRGVQWEKAFLVHKFSGSLLALPPCTDFCIFKHIQVLWWFQQHQTGEGNSKRHHHEMSLLSHLHLSFLCLWFSPFQF